jgi:hypothetical protein
MVPPFAAPTNVIFSPSLHAHRAWWGGEFKTSS